jgi:DNA polymerase-3 subunit delta
MDPQVKKIWTDLKAGQYAPVYFLHGEETFYIDLIANYIENNALSESERGFNQVIMYGKDVSVAAILTNARRYPMMSERQVVIVKEAQDVPDLNKEIGVKLMLDYLTKPTPSTILVFCHKHKPIDKRRELGKKIDQFRIVVMTTKKLYDNQLPEFVYEYTQEKKVRIEDQAVHVLCEYVGNDLHRIANEIDKLTISLSSNDTISVDDVMSQVGVSKEYNIFELQRAILKRDSVVANKIVNYFASNTKKNPMIPVVAFLYSFFSKLLIAAQVGNKSEKGLASELKVSPYAVRDYTLALRQFPLPKILDNLGSIKEADLKLKGVNTGSTDEGQIFRELIWRIMN